MKVFAIKNKCHFKRKIPRLPFIVISPSTAESGCSNQKCCFALIVFYPLYFFSIWEMMFQSEEEKEVMVVGDWMNLKLFLGLDLDDNQV